MNLSSHGFSDASSFVESTIKGRTESWLQPATATEPERLVLVKRNGAKQIAVVEAIKSAEGDHYNVVHATIRTRNKYTRADWVKLWDGAAVPSATTGSIVPQSIAPLHVQADDTERSGQSLTTDSIPQNSPAPVKPVGGVVGTVGGSSVPYVWAVQEGADLIPSHDPQEFTPNPAYADALPANTQPRDRTSPIAMAQVFEIEHNGDPRRLEDSPLAQQGAPVIDEKNFALSGNGRLMGLMRAYLNRRETATRYKQYLIDHATRFGLDPDTIRAMKAPVLVRRGQFADAESKKAFADTANQQDGMRMTDTEQAKADQGFVPDDIMGLMRPNDRGLLDSQDNTGFLQAIMKRIPNSESGSMLEGKYLSQTGLRRLAAALLYKAYGSGDLVTRIYGNTSVEGKNITNALQSIVLRLLKQRAEGKPDVSQGILAAADTYLNRKATGKPIADLLTTNSLFSDTERSQGVKDFLRFFDAHASNAATIQEGLNAILDEVDRADMQPHLAVYTDADPLSKVSGVLQGITEEKARQKAQKAADKPVGAAAAAVPKELVPGPPGRVAKMTVAEQLAAAEAQALAEIEAMRRTRDGLPPGASRGAVIGDREPGEGSSDMLVAYAKLGAIKIARGAVAFADWVKEMSAAIGEHSDAFWQQLRTQSDAYHTQNLGPLPPSPESEETSAMPPVVRALARLAAQDPYIPLAPDELSLRNERGQHNLGQFQGETQEVSRLNDEYAANEIAAARGVAVLTDAQREQRAREVLQQFGVMTDTDFANYRENGLLPDAEKATALQMTVQHHFLQEMDAARAYVAAEAAYQAGEISGRELRQAEADLFSSVKAGQFSYVALRGIATGAGRLLRVFKGPAPLMSGEEMTQAEETGRAREAAKAAPEADTRAFDPALTAKMAAGDWRRDNKFFTIERAEAGLAKARAAAARLKKPLSGAVSLGGDLPDGSDAAQHAKDYADLVSGYAEYGLSHMEALARIGRAFFTDWAQAMTHSLGEEIKPYLEDVWEESRILAAKENFTKPDDQAPAKRPGPPKRQPRPKPAGPVLAPPLPEAATAPAPARGGRGGLPPLDRPLSDEDFFTSAQGEGFGKRRPGRLPERTEADPTGALPGTQEPPSNAAWREQPQVGEQQTIPAIRQQQQAEALANADAMDARDAQTPPARTVGDQQRLPGDKQTAKEKARWQMAQLFPKNQLPPDLIRQWARLPDDDAKATARFLKAMNQQYIKPRYSQWNAMQKANLLASLTSVLTVDIASMHLHRMESALDRGIESLLAPFDAAARRAAGEQDARRAVVPGEFRAGWIMEHQAFVEGLANARSIMQDGYSNDQAVALDIPPEADIPNPWLFVLRLRAAAYAVNGTMARSGELARQAVRKAYWEGQGTADPARVQELFQNPTDEMNHAADLYATTVNHQNSGLDTSGKRKPTAILPIIDQARQWMPFEGAFAAEDKAGTLTQRQTNVKFFRPIDSALPFVRVAVNIANEAVERVPVVGAAKLLHPDIRSDSTARLRIEANQVKGALVAAALIPLVLAGRMTGSMPLDTKRRRQWQLDGKQPESIKIGHTWLSYRGISGPWQPVLSVLGDLGNEMSDGRMPPALRISHAINDAGHSITDLSMLQGLRDFNNVLTGQQGAAERYFTGQAWSYVPLSGAIRNLQQVTDPAVRVPHGIGERLAQSVPGLSYTVPAAVAPFGQDLQRGEGNRGIWAIMPVKWGRESSDPIAREMVRLGVNVPGASDHFKRGNTEIRLTPLQKRQMLQSIGHQVYSALQQEMATDAYRTDPATGDETTDEQKTSYLTEVAGAYKAFAEQVYLQQAFPHLRAGGTGTGG